MNRHGLFADVIVTIHLGIVLFVVLGLFLILLGVFYRWTWVRNLWLRLVHVATIGIVVIEGLAGIECPLTTWERQLRELAGQPVSDASFMGRLANGLLFYDAPEYYFTMGHCIFGVLVALTFALAPPQWRTPPNSQR